MRKFGNKENLLAVAALELAKSSTQSREATKTTQQPSKANSSATQTTNEKLSVPPKIIAGIFKIFQARYGHKFTSSIDGIEKLAVDEWAKRLTGLTREQIAHGLKTWSNDWPPSSEEFRKQCEGSQNSKNDYGLNFIPQMHRAENRKPERDKSKLLSNSNRELTREQLREFVIAARNVLAQQ